MRTGILLGLFAAAFVGPQVQAQSSDEAPLLPGQVKFLKLPGADARFEYFPAEARKNRIEGRGTVVCRIAEGGRLEGCQVKAEDPPGQGFGEATARLVQGEIRLDKTAIDGKPTAGRSFQVTRIFALRGGAGTKDAQPLDPGKVGQDGLRRRWIQAPDPRVTERCFRGFSKAEDVQLTLSCKSTVDDRFSECRVTKNSRAPDVRYEQAGICAIESGRFRVEDAQGKPVSGVEISVPFSRRRQD